MSGLELARWALYVDLGLLFGVPAATVLLRCEAIPGFNRRLLLALSILAFPLIIVGFLLLVTQMAGGENTSLDPNLISELLTGSALGWAALARFIALTAVLTVLGWTRSNLRWLLLPAVIALGSLVWSGHAASSEGWRSVLRLSFDIGHLLAASIWIGALVLFLAMLSNGVRTECQAAEALSRFAGIGSMLVGILLATGIGNLMFLVSPGQWPAMLRILYGRLLLLKFCVFLGMLALAVLNRFILVPRLQDRGAAAVSTTALRSLKLSIVLEMALGMAVLLLVSRLGLLDPTGT